MENRDASKTHKVPTALRIQGNRGNMLLKWGNRLTSHRTWLINWWRLQDDTVCGFRGLLHETASILVFIVHSDFNTGTLVQPVGRAPEKGQQINVRCHFMIRKRFPTISRSTYKFLPPDFGLVFTFIVAVKFWMTITEKWKRLSRHCLLISSLPELHWDWFSKLTVLMYNLK